MWQRLVLAGGLHHELPVPSISPVADRLKVRSVTLTSGMIATLRVTMPVTSSSRLSVTTSFSTYQSAMIQIHRSDHEHAEPDQHHPDEVDPGQDPREQDAEDEQQTAWMVSAASTAQCRRMLMASRSMGSRYFEGSATETYRTGSEPVADVLVMTPALTPSTGGSSGCRAPTPTAPRSRRG